MTDSADPTDTDGDDLRDVLGMAARRAPPRVALGQVIDDAYRIEDEIGEGGMGRVYRAHDLRLGRDVALKLHARARALDDDTLRVEAAALARLAHPNVVTVHEVGEWSGHHWVAMEYVPGGTARTWARGRSARDIIELYVAAGRGLAAAHAVGLVHRDFKPDNVLVGADGRPRVADFGLARAAGSDAVGGTPGYMAPEQAAGEAVGPAADQYAFAVALWEALAGEKPLARAKELPRHVEAALRRALALEPEDRWPSLALLLDELARDPVRARRRAAVLAAAGLVLAVGGFAASRWMKEERASCELAPLAEWTPERAAALRPHLADVADRAVGAVDAWAADWRVQRREACEVPEGRVRDLRGACLDRARAQLAAALDLLPDAKPSAAMQLVVDLPRLRTCADVAELAGGAVETAPIAVAEVAAATALTARARALAIAGRMPAAAAAAREAVAYADAIGVPSEQARARIELAKANSANGHMEGTVEMFEDAARRAAEAKDDALAVTAWLAVLDALGVRHERPEEAERLLVAAEAAVARAGETPSRRSALLAIRADLLIGKQKYAEALPLLLEAEKLAVAGRGPDDPDLARTYNRIAGVLKELDRRPEALVYFDRAIKLLERLYGPQHPNIAAVLTTRSGLETDAGDFAASIADLQRALAIKEAVVGPDHATLLPTLYNLSIVTGAQGDYPAALAYARRCASLAERSLPAGHPRLGTALSVLGTAEHQTGDDAAAERDLERARQILEPRGGPELAAVYRWLALVRLARKDVRGARAAAERGIAVAGAETIEGVRVRMVHAKALAAAGDRAGARRELEAARARAVELVGEDGMEAQAAANELDALR